jgi:hypothetical protein
MSEYAITYRGHTIEPLVFVTNRPRQGKSLPLRRYNAAVNVTNHESGTMQSARLPSDFEFFGDARRAAESRGRALVDHPEAAAELDAAFSPQREAPAPVESPFSATSVTPAPTPAA